MINETEIIDNVVKLDGKVSQRTLDEMNPWVEDPDVEQKRRSEDEKAMLEKQEWYQFNNDLTQPTKNEETTPETANEDKK